MARSRRAAINIVAAFERAAELNVLRGSLHPDLREWTEQSYLVARERLICHLTNQPVHHLRLPPQPVIDYSKD